MKARYLRDKLNELSDSELDTELEITISDCYTQVNGLVVSVNAHSISDVEINKSTDIISLVTFPISGSSTLRQNKSTISYDISVIEDNQVTESVKIP